jgi:hypothetical protein
MKPIAQRVSFNVVINDDKLMGKLWKKLSVPQQTILLAAYGLELPTKSHHAAWSILNGKFEMDELGYPTKIYNLDYSPSNYDTVVGLIGRRSGKSFVTCFAILYEVLFGGHLPKVEPGEEMVFPYIAQDLPTARRNMKMIGLLCQQVKTLSPALTKFGSDTLEFYDGLIKVQIEPPRVKTGRGWAMPVAIMDEVGFWSKLSDAADPDYEVQASVTPSQLQFAPNNKTFIISSPYTEEGILFEYWRGGTNGMKLADGDEDKDQFKGTLVMNAPTAAMQNPKFDPAAERRFLEKERAKDPEVFKREYLGQFVTSISGFLTQNDIISATDKGVKERKIEEIKKKGFRHHFVSAMDPAFRNDDFVYGIFHKEENGNIVQDLLRVWSPNKKLGIVLNPNEILQEIGKLNKEWGMTVTYSDQGQLESLAQLAIHHGFNIIGSDFTRKSKPKMFGSLKNLFRQKKIRLLDLPVVYSQLTKLQQKNTPSGGIQIFVPHPGHDDVADVIALGTECAIQLTPTKELVKPEPTQWDLCIADMKRKKRLAEDGWRSFTEYSRH